MTLASFIKDDAETLDTFKRGLAHKPDLSGVTDGSHAPNMFLETRVHKALLAHIERQGITPSFIRLRNGDSLLFINEVPPPMPSEGVCRDKASIPL